MTNIDNNIQSMGNYDTGPTQKVLSRKELSPDDFISLFLKQLTNQNPLHPADSSTILQQMADISTISASKSTQKAIADLKQSVNITLGNSQVLAATQLIGKKVEVPSNLSPLVKDEGLSGSVMLPGATSNIKVVIKDEKGQTVKELALDPATSGGLVEFKWNGIKDDGQVCDPGFYNVSATASFNGKEIPINTAGAFKVKSVASNPNSGEVILNVDGLGGLGLNDIIKIL